VNKYCSVRDSLREDIPVEWTLTIDGENPERTTSGSATSGSAAGDARA